MQAAEIRAAFDTMAWESPAPYVRIKAIRRNGVQLRVVEFTRGFAEHDWCEKRHIGYVLSGEISIETPEGVTHVHEGQGIVLSGVHAKHRASPVTDSVTLFLLEDT